jgi:ankyrin repeat protein
MAIDADFLTAALSGNFGAMKTMLSGNDRLLDSIDGNGDPVICIVIGSDRSKNSLSVVDFMMKNGADPNAPGQNGKTALHLAAWLGTSAFVPILLRGGADVNCKNWNGDTPLHHAAKQGRCDIIEMLLAGGADVNAENNHRQLPLIHALNGKQRRAETLLREHGGVASLQQNDIIVTWTTGAQGKKIDPRYLTQEALREFDLSCPGRRVVGSPIALKRRRKLMFMFGTENNELIVTVRHAGDDDAMRLRDCLRELFEKHGAEGQVAELPWDKDR